MTTGTKKSGSAERWGPLWGARAQDWAQIEEQQTPTYQAALRRVNVQEGQRVLDIGCGTGVFLSLAAARGAEVFGFDASESLLAVARRRLPKADLRAGDMQSLPYDDSFFDIVAGFNSFFYAADMVGAFREAGRVAKPGAPVVIQVWGAPERCNLDALKRAVGRLLPPPDPNAPSPPKLWEPGVLEGIAEAAGLTPDYAFDSGWAFQFPDSESLLQAMLAPGVVMEAINAVGEAPVREATVEALAPYRNPEGGYRLENEWRYLIARAL